MAGNANGTTDMAYSRETFGTVGNMQRFISEINGAASFALRHCSKQTQLAEKTLTDTSKRWMGETKHIPPPAGDWMWPP